MAGLLEKYGYQSPNSMPTPQASNGGLLDKYVIPNAQPQTTIGQDLKNTILQGIMGAGDFAMRVPSELEDAYTQSRKNPLGYALRTAENIGSGVLEDVKGAWNLPAQIQTYLAKKGVPVFGTDVLNKIQIGDTGLQKAVMGDSQPSDELWQVLGGLIGPGKIAKDLSGVKSLAVRPSALMSRLQLDKTAEFTKAAKDYSKLFEDAKNAGIETAIPSQKVINAIPDILGKTDSDYHQSFINYIDNPTLENAHWAQSDLAALKRKYDSASRYKPLSPEDNRIKKMVSDIQQEIRKGIFEENIARTPKKSMSPTKEIKEFDAGEGLHPSIEEFTNRYNELGKNYQKVVVPYMRLSELKEYPKKMRAKTAAKSLYSDEEFMTQLAKKYPGIYAQSPALRKALALTGIVLGVQGGGQIIKNLLK